MPESKRSGDCDECGKPLDIHGYAQFKVVHPTTYARMPKFKVGQQVRFREETHLRDLPKELTGVIEEIDVLLNGRQFNYTLLGGWYHFESELEAVDE